MKSDFRSLDIRSHCFSPRVIPEKNGAIRGANERRTQAERKNSMEDEEKQREREMAKNDADRRKETELIFSADDSRD